MDLTTLVSAHFSWYLSLGSPLILYLGNLQPPSGAWARQGRYPCTRTHAHSHARTLMHTTHASRSAAWGVACGGATCARQRVTGHMRRSMMVHNMRQRHVAWRSGRRCWWHRALFTIFQCITLDGWTAILYAVEDGARLLLLLWCVCACACAQSGVCASVRVCACAYLCSTFVCACALRVCMRWCACVLQHAAPLHVRIVTSPTFRSTRAALRRVCCRAALRRRTSGVALPGNM